MTVGKPDVKAALKWVESPVRGVNIHSVVFNPDNSIVAACSKKECLLFDAESGAQLCFVEQKSPLVGCFFKSNTELATVVSEGELLVWSIEDVLPSQIVSYNLPAKPLFAFPGGSIGEGVVITSPMSPKKGKKESEKSSLSLQLIKENGELKKLSVLPANSSPDSVAVSTDLVALCDGKHLKIVARSPDAKVKSSEFLTKRFIDYLGAINELNIFETVDARGDTVAASLTMGCTFIWRDVLKVGIEREQQFVHWHKAAPSVGLSPAGGLFSAGGECCLAKWNLSDRRPFFLPRLHAPIRRLVLAPDDAARVALLLEDNSVVIVHSASMTVESRIVCVARTDRMCSANMERAKGEHPLPSSSLQPPPLPLLCHDLSQTAFVVASARPGWIQWLDPIASSAPIMVDISLENTVDADNLLNKVRQTYHRVTQACFSFEHVLTVERGEGRTIGEESEEEAQSRVRIWKRNKQKTALSLEHTVHVPGKIEYVACPPFTGRQPLLAIIDDKGVGSIIEKGKSQQWHSDPSRAFSWKSAPCRAASSLSISGALAAAYQVTDTTDSVVVWCLETRRILGVLEVDGQVRSLGWCNESNNVLVAATSTAIYAWTTHSLSLRWRINEACWAQTLPRLIVWKEHQVLLLCPLTGRPLSRFSTKGVIRNTLAFQGNTTDRDISEQPKTAEEVLVQYEDGTLSVLVKEERAALLFRSNGGGGLLPRARSASISMSPQKEATKKTPAATPRPQLAPKPALAALKEPAYMLPAINHIAPAFIRSCLLPLPLKTD